MDRVRAAAIRTLFVQIRTSIASGTTVTTYAVLVSLPYTRWPIVAAWAAGQIAAQLGREVLRRAWHRAQPDDEGLVSWVNAYTALMALSGVIWGLAIVFLAHPDQPITVALTLCALFGMCGGAVAGQSYNPAGLYALIWGTFIIVFARLALTGEAGYILVGVTCITFAMAMSAFGRVQARVLDDGYRIRFENAELVEALTVQTAEAEAARRQAEVASLAKSQFLAAASHDLRQPLYALSLFSAALDELKLDDAGRRVVGQIGDSIAVMEQLFDGLLDISRLEAGVVRPRPEPVAVNALFDRLSQVFWPQATQRGIELRLRSNGEWVSSDVGLLERALANLIANALSATAAGGVLVAARRRGAGLRFEVYDTGRGIAEADRARIFDEFVQVDNPERDRRKGLGLGLGIARRSLGLIGAGVTLRSHPGRGSRFAFDQPLCAPPAVDVAEPLSKPATMSLSTHGLVMVVDDDHDVRMALGELFGRWGIRADLYAAPGPALDRLREGERYRLVLSDYRMPGDMDGLDFIVAARGLHAAPMPPCALVTGDVDPQLLARAAEADIAVLYKPLSRETLRHWLQKSEAPGEGSGDVADIPMSPATLVA